jgi:hypothetical protein
VCYRSRYIILWYTLIVFYGLGEKSKSGPPARKSYPRLNVRATLYEGVGIVKRQFQSVSHEARLFLHLRRTSLPFFHFDQGSLRESQRWKLVPPTIYSVTHIRP